jgi:hypothetical protein
VILSAARKSIPYMRRCILSGLLLTLSRIRVATSAVELGIDETTVRRRRDREQGGDWTLDDLAVLLAYERDALGSRALLDAVIEADGRDSLPAEPREAAAVTGQLAREMAQTLAAMLQRLSDQHLDARESAMTADDIDHLVVRAQAAVRVLRARATTHL